MQQVKEWFEKYPPDPDVQIRFRGEDEEQKEAGQFLTMAFAIALFLMMLILTTQFNSLYRMVVIMSAVFFSTGGVLLGLLVTWEPFGIVMCGVGIISLAGIVVNNNIIFIDTYQEIRDRGAEVYEALILTGQGPSAPYFADGGDNRAWFVTNGICYQSGYCRAGILPSVHRPASGGFSSLPRLQAG